MTDTSSEIRNYFKLELLLARSYVILRQLFKKRYSQFNNGAVWDDSPTCGNNYLANINSNSKKIPLTAVQRTSIANGNSNEWDSTTLIALLLNIDCPKTMDSLQIQQLDQEDKLLKQIRDIRNNLAHHPSKSVGDAEFNRLWTDLARILVAFGDDDNELDKLKDDSVFESHNQVVNEENVKEATRLNTLGTQAYNDKKFSEAITIFTKGTVLPGISEYDRAKFYSNISASRLLLFEQQTSSTKKFELINAEDQRYRALQDAKQARRLWSTWWKAHFRVGKVYSALNEHEKAINLFERALALDPINDQIQQALDDSRSIYGRQSRQEHLDPRWMPRTILEYLKEAQDKLGVDPEHVRLGHSILEKTYPSGADVVRGNQYVYGDSDVKQDYEQAARYYAKAANQGNAEGM